MADTDTNKPQAPATSKVSADEILRRLEAVEKNQEIINEPAGDQSDPYYAPMSESARVSVFPEVGPNKDENQTEYYNNLLVEAQKDYDSKDDSEDGVRVIDARHRQLHDESVLSYVTSDGAKHVAEYNPGK